MRVLLLVAVVLVGCGPAPVDLVGTYEGMLTTAPSAACGGKGRTEAATYEIGAGPVLKRFGSCVDVKLDQVAATATAQPTTCPADAVWPAETKILGGTLTLDGKNLVVALRFEAGCEVALTGTLTRK